LQITPIDPERWLPPGKKAALCFSIDDVHPGRSDQHYDGGGDLDKGVLGLLRQLLLRHPQLCMTLFTTPDWREISPKPSRAMRLIPWIRERTYLAKILPKGSRSIARAPEFVGYLRELPRTEIALHGLHHIHTGAEVHVEFQHESLVECSHVLHEALSIFEQAGLSRPLGMCPPGWNAPPALVAAMVVNEFSYVASSRDIRTPIVPGATANMSGIKNTPLIQPARLESGLLHFSTNFQATSPIERAFEVIRNSGILAIKGHAVKNAMGFVALDGIDAVYFNYLDLLFDKLQREFGDTIWWTTFGEIATRINSIAPTEAPE
jgi:Uncharacterized protein conserved in bacteria (DUF2334)